MVERDRDNGLVLRCNVAGCKCEWKANVLECLKNIIRIGGTIVLLTSI